MSNKDLQDEIDSLRIVLKERCKEIEELREYILKLESSLNLMIVNRERFHAQTEW